jgi:MFS family permease
MTAEPGRVSLRSFWGQLPTSGRWLLSTVALQTLGRGLTLPFTIIYVNEVRGIPLGQAGALMAIIAGVALLLTGPAGSATDRVGARVVLLVASTAQLVGCVVLAFASTPLTFAAGFVLLGVNFGLSWPAFNALIAAVVSGRMRQQYFGINFALVNLGIGVGGVIGGMFVDVHHPLSFTLIFLGDGAGMLVPIALLLGPLRRLDGRVPAPLDGADAAPGGSYLSILRRPAVIWMTILTFTTTFVGYGQMEAGFPAFARQVGEVSTRAIGFAFAVNTATIVVFQFLVLRLIDGHRRTRVLVGMTVLWALAWLLLGGTGLVAGTAMAVVGVLAFHAVFALGETLMQPSIPAIINDLADDHLRGRYNAVNAGAFQGGTILAPVAAGILLERGWSTAFIAMAVAGCVAVAAMALVVERLITPVVNGVTEPAPAAAAPG